MADTDYPPHLFWPKVDVRGENECWPWLAGKDTHGYGKVKTRAMRSPACAHRVSFSYSNGPIPDGLLIRHKCDNPNCVNPNHLETGTHLDNSADSKKRNRHRHGSGHHNATLTEDKVRAIRFVHTRLGWSPQRTGRLFNLGFQHVHDIVRGRIWVHVEGAY